MTRIWPYHYYKEYDSKQRFISYWHQIDEILSLNPERVLEVGIGNGFVSNYLARSGITVMTLDIDKRLNPDVVGSVLKIPFPDRSFNVVSCCEVLEHLPYEDFTRALSEIYRVSRLHAVLSLPDITRVCRVNIQIPTIGEIRKLVRLPMLRRPIPNFNKEVPSEIGTVGYSIEHYWQIGESGYPLYKIIKDIKSVGFKIQKIYRVFELPLHRFFVLEKEGDLCN